jgi:hypothetical protein
LYIFIKLRTISGHKRDEVIGGCRTLHNEELYNLYTIPNIIIIIKSRKMSWTEHVALVREKRNAYRVPIREPKEKRRLGKPRGRGRMIVKWILEK